MKNNLKTQKRRLQIRCKFFIFIFIFILTFFFQSFLFKDENYFDKKIRNIVMPVRLVYSFTKHKVCASSEDDICRTVTSGIVRVPSNAVMRIKVLQDKKKGFFVTFRRNYVVVSYYLKYLKDVPQYYFERVNTMPHHQYKKYSTREIENYVKNCTSVDPKLATKIAPTHTKQFIEHTAGEQCTCASYKLFNGKNNVLRSSLNCNLARIALTGNSLVFSRHCAYMSDFYYSVYSIDYPPIFNTYVEITLQEYFLNDEESTRARKSNLVITEKSYTLNDSVKSLRDDYFDILITIEREQAGKIGIVNMSDSYIVLPSAPLKNFDAPYSDVANNCGLSKNSPLLKGCDYNNKPCSKIHPCLAKGLMLPSALFDLTGSSCKKIGISYNRWRFPPSGNFCRSPPGFCLENKLSSYVDLHRKLEKKMVASDFKIKNLYNSEPQVRLFNKSNIPEQLKSVVTSASSPNKKMYTSELAVKEPTATHPLFIDYKYNGEHIVDLKFETTSMDVYEIRPVGDAAITHVTVPDNCKSTSIHSTDCVVTVHAWNSSKTSMINFKCQIECFEHGTNNIVPHIAPIEPISANIKANENYAYYFIIKFLSTGATKTECTAKLLDLNGKMRANYQFDLESKPIERIVDRVLVKEEAVVTVTKIKDDVSLTNTNKLQASEAVCGCGFNLFCYFFNMRKCVTYYTRKIYSVVGNLALLAIIVIMAPALIPFLPFIFTFLIKFICMPLKIACFCSRMKKKSAFSEKGLMKKKQKDINEFENEDDSYFRKPKKKHINKYEDSKKKKRINSSEENSFSDLRNESDYYSHKKKKKKNYNRSSQYSSTSLDETISTVSTPSVDSSGDENLSEKSHRTKNVKKSKKHKKHTHSEESSSSLISSECSDISSKKKIKHNKSHYHKNKPHKK